MPDNITDIAYEFGLTEEELTTEALRAFLKDHVRQLEAELRSHYVGAGVDSLQGMENLCQQGVIREEEYQEVYDLAGRAHRIGMLLEDLPGPAAFPPTLDQVKEILQVKAPVLAEFHGIRVLGIYGPYAAGKPRSYDRIGLLVELLNPLGLEFFGLEGELSKILGAPVQVSTQEGLWPNRAQRIMSELVEI